MWRKLVLLWALLRDAFRLGEAVGRSEGPAPSTPPPPNAEQQMGGQG